MTPSVSLICCHTGKSKLAYLDNSLAEQNLACERIYLDNSEGKFTSAAAALNHGAAKASGDLLLFCHQDVRFKEPDSLCALVGACQSLKVGDVAGVAGATSHKGKKLVYTDITHGLEEQPYTDTTHVPQPFAEVETVDECVIIMLRTTWEHQRFNERLCDGWHLYAAEFCLAARKAGGRVLTLPACVNHISAAGRLNKDYFDCVRRLVTSYADTFDHVATTVEVWPVRHLELKILEKRIRRIPTDILTSRP